MGWVCLQRLIHCYCLSDDRPDPFLVVEELRRTAGYEPIDPIGDTPRGLLLPKLLTDPGRFVCDETVPERLLVTYFGEAFAVSQPIFFGIDASQLFADYELWLGRRSLGFLADIVRQRAA
jgi:hypothetical protein